MLRLCMCKLAALSTKQRPESKLAKLPIKHAMDGVVTGALTKPHDVRLAELSIALGVALWQQAREQIFVAFVMAGEHAIVATTLGAALLDDARQVSVEREQAFRAHQGAS